MSPRFLRIPDAQAYSGLSRTALYLALARGQITARKDGKATLVDRESLDQHLDTLPSANIRLPKTVGAQ